MSWSYVTPRRRNRQACSSVHIPGTPSALFGPTTTAANTPPDQDIARNPRSAQATRTAQPLTVKPYHVVLRKTGLERLGVPGPLAEIYADCIDWHQIAQLMRRGCPP